jgi:hypothetical protein
MRDDRYVFVRLFVMTNVNADYWELCSCSRTVRPVTHRDISHGNCKLYLYCSSKFSPLSILNMC